MVFVWSLYLNQNQSYGQKGVLDLFGDLDLDLDPISTKIKSLQGIICTYLYVKYLSDTLKTVTARVSTDRRTDRQTDKQTD